MPFRPLLSLSLIATACLAHADTRWFTVTGDAQDDAAETVQVDPVARTAAPHRMQVRVSRAEPRISWDGIPYRSFTADVQVDCAAGRARYASIAYHLQPRWQGPVHREVDYRSGEPRWMEFRDMKPNPMRRIVAAACDNPPRRATPAS